VSNVIDFVLEQLHLCGHTQFHPYPVEV